MLEFFREAAAAACLVDALRGSMIVGGTSAHALGASFGVMPLAFALLLALASKLYPGLAPQAPEAAASVPLRAARWLL